MSTFGEVPTFSISTMSLSLSLTNPGGFHQFVPPEGYEGGGGISPLTPPFIVGSHGHPLVEGMEMPPDFLPPPGVPLDGRVGGVSTIPVMRGLNSMRDAHTLKHKNFRTALK